jgi:hypothetical protein
MRHRGHMPWNAGMTRSPAHGPVAATTAFGQLVDGQLGVPQRVRDRRDDRVGLLGRQPDVLGEGAAGRGERGQRTGPRRQVLGGKQVYRAARSVRLDQAALGPQGVLDVGRGDAVHARAHLGQLLSQTAAILVA